METFTFFLQYLRVLTISYFFRGQAPNEFWEVQHSKQIQVLLVPLFFIGAHSKHTVKYRKNEPWKIHDFLTPFSVRHNLIMHGRFHFIENCFRALCIN